MAPDQTSIKTANSNRNSCRIPGSMVSRFSESIKCNETDFAKYYISVSGIFLKRSLLGTAFRLSIKIFFFVTWLA
jgi:hypothetical protein